MTPCENKDIDWGKAPKDATHYHDPYFYKVVDGKVMVFGCFSDGWDASSYGAKEVSMFIPRPLKPEWDGTGLPPVGAVVECLCPESKVWVKCDIIGPYGDYVVGAPSGGGFYGFDANELRPIRSDRDKAIDDMMRILNNVASLAHQYHDRIAAALYDAGYRKQQETKA